MGYKIIIYYTLHLFLAINISKANSECVKSLCVTKCCPENEYLYNGQCDTMSTSTIKPDFSDLSVYDSNLMIVGKYKGGVIFVEKKSFEVIPSASSFTSYLLEDGNLYTKIVLPNAFPKINIVENGHFCVEYSQKSDGKVTPAYALYKESTTKDMTFSIVALIISCVFLLLVLIIYAILKELRNPKGLITMAMVLSLFGAFSTLATYQIITNDDSQDLTEDDCLGFTCTIYFFFLATFCWMNVMSFDIWMTFRRITRAKNFKILGMNCTFLIYCLYAWGLPFVLTIAMKVIDQSDLSDQPWIIKPNIVGGGCFISGKEKLLYLYLPMLILVLSNWIFFLLTAGKIWLITRSMNVLNTHKSNKFNQMQRFLIFLKLSLVMGISYILEVISSLYPDSPFWYVTDAYNMFIGVAIFLIFVCKRRIFEKLSDRFFESTPVDTIVLS